MKKSEPGKIPRILIVEDDPVIARALSQRLKNLGYEVCGIASTGAGAVELAGKDSPDLVLMDVRLEGGMEGTEAAASIRSFFNVPIVFVTAHADDQVLESAKKADPFGYLIKPYTETALRTTIEMSLYKARAEKALVQANKEWESTFDAVSDLIMILDNEHRIVRANKATLDKLGTTAQNLIGRFCFQTVHGLDAPPPTCPHSRLLADGKVHRVEFAEERLGGVFEVSVSPCRDAQGRLWGSVHVAHDITERKRAEEEREKLIVQLQQALAQVKQLSGFLPICASCKKIRDDQGYWRQVEEYIREHSEAEFSHSICPDCAKRLYPELYEDDIER